MKTTTHPWSFYGLALVIGAGLALGGGISGTRAGG